MNHQVAPDTLEQFNRQTLRVVRLSESSFEFPILGVRVSPPDDWVYLSTTNPAIAAQPTFYNATDQLVIRLMHPALWKLDANQPTAPDRATAVGQSVPIPGSRSGERSDNVNPPIVRWYDNSFAKQNLNLTVDGFPIEVSWRSWSPFRTGRFRNDQVDLILQSLVTNRGNPSAQQRSARTNPHADQLTDQPSHDQSIAKFCQQVERLDH